MAAERRPDGRPDGRQARWDEHNQERRRRILEAAVGVIGEGEPGAEVHVQQIAERAGLSRTVVYRHFADRADLDRAVQAAILDDLWAGLLPAVSLDGSIGAIIERIVSTYVGWAVAHPALHRFAELDPDGSGPLQQGLEQVAVQIAELIQTAVELLGVQLDADEQASLDPLVFGLVGAVFGAVRRWVSRPERAPSAPVLVQLVTESVWHIIEGHGRRLGVELARDVPVEQLLAAVPDPAAGRSQA